jgi:hypothetical protein
MNSGGDERREKSGEAKQRWQFAEFLESKENKSFS